MLKIVCDYKLIINLFIYLLIYKNKFILWLQPQEEMYNLNH
jgi:hypothetical protein